MKEVLPVERIAGFICVARVDSGEYHQMFGREVPGERSTCGCQSLGWRGRLLPFPNREDAAAVATRLTAQSHLSEVVLAYIEMEIADSRADEDIECLREKGPWVVLQGSEGVGGTTFYGPQHPSGDIQLFGELGATGFEPFRDFEKMKRWCFIDIGRRGGCNMRVASWRMEWMD